MLRKIVLGSAFADQLKADSFEIEELRASDEEAALKVMLCSTSSTSSTSTASTSAGR